MLHMVHYCHLAVAWAHSIWLLSHVSQCSLHRSLLVNSHTAHMLSCSLLEHGVRSGLAANKCHILTANGQSISSNVV